MPEVFYAADDNYLVLLPANGVYMHEHIFAAPVHQTTIDLDVETLVNVPPLTPTTEDAVEERDEDAQRVVERMNLSLLGFHDYSLRGIAPHSGELLAIITMALLSVTILS